MDVFWSDPPGSVLFLFQALCMVHWHDALFGDNGEQRPCVLLIERDDVRLTVEEDIGPDGHAGYMIELYSFSDLRMEWRLIGRLGDFDLHTVAGLLLEAGSELYHRRVVKNQFPPMVDD